MTLEQELLSNNCYRRALPRHLSCVLVLAPHTHCLATILARELCDHVIRRKDATLSQFLRLIASLLVRAQMMSTTLWLVRSLASTATGFCSHQMTLIRAVFRGIRALLVAAVQLEFLRRKEAILQRKILKKALLL